VVIDFPASFETGVLQLKIRLPSTSDGARAARAFAAPVFRAGEREVFPQHFEERPLPVGGGHVHLAAVHAQRNGVAGCHV
jgi:hypothetical protein